MQNSDVSREFPETNSKDILRNCDLFLIEKLQKESGHKLCYLGLPGIDAKDVLTWKDTLDYVVAIERLDKDSEEARAAFKTSLLLKLTPVLYNNIKIVFDDVWSMLASGRLIDFQRVPQVINLDFCGGMHYTAMDYPKQMSAFHELFKRLRTEGVEALIFFTLNPRDIGHEKYIDYLQERINIVKPILGSKDKKISSEMDESIKFHQRNNLLLFKACLPIMLYEVGASSNYEISLVYALRYRTMVHLALKCKFHRGAYGYPQDPIELINILNQSIHKIDDAGKIVEPATPPRIRVISGT